MKIYKTQQEVKKDIKNNVLSIDGDVKFECSISIPASIIVSGNIEARNIEARAIDACDISALDLIAENITARNIEACDISYYAFCCVYRSIKCFSIKAIREKHQKPICLDGELTIVKES
jgi:hypothetical protein